MAALPLRHPRPHFDSYVIKGKARFGKTRFVKGKLAIAQLRLRGVFRMSELSPDGRRVARSLAGRHRGPNLALVVLGRVHGGVGGLEQIVL